jgi:hypothetical protein
MVGALVGTVVGTAVGARVGVTTDVAFESTDCTTVGSRLGNAGTFIGVEDAGALDTEVADAAQPAANKPTTNHATIKLRNETL